MKESPDARGPVEPSPRERAALRAILGVAALACLIAVAVPAEFRLAAASRLSRDGQLGPATLSLLRTVPALAAAALSALAGVWLARGRLARGLGAALGALSKPSSRTFTLWLVVGALALRFAWIAAVRSEPTSDFLEYWELGKRLADTGAYTLANGAPTAFRPPGYPAFLAALHTVFGDALWPARVANAAFGAATAAMTWRIFRDRIGEGPARLAAIIVAVFPSQIGYTSLLATEIPFTALQLATLLFLSRATEATDARAAAKWAAAAGAAMSLAAMTRPTIVLLPLFVAPVIFARVGMRRMLLIGAVGALLAAPLPVAWGVRNARALGAFQPFSTNGGVNFHFGNNAVTNGTGFEMLDPEVDETSGICDEVARNQRGWELGAMWWRDHPGDAAVLAARKLGWLLATDGVWTRWSILTAKPRPSESVRVGAMLLSTAAWWLLLAFALVEYGVFRWRPAARASAEPFSEAMILCTIATTLLFIGQERYHFPLVPLMAGGVAGMVSRVSVIAPLASTSAR